MSRSRSETAKALPRPPSTSIHAAVARYYADLIARADWAAFDAYGARHALGHFAAADRVAEIHEVLRAERSLDGRFVNGWFSVRTTHGRARDFVDDVEQVWSRVAEHANPELHVRYALYLRSVWAIYERVPPTVLAVALEAGVLTESDVRSAVEVRSDRRSRARAYRLLAEGDEAGTTWTEAIAQEVRAALRTQQVDTRKAVLTELAAVAPPDLIGPLLESLPSDCDAEKILAALGDRVPLAELDQALELADQIRPVVPWARARIPLLLAAGVPRPEIGDWLREDAIRATEAEAVGLLVELAKLSGPADDVVDDIVVRLERLDYDQDLAPAVGWFAALGPAIRTEHLTRVLIRMDRQYRDEDVYGVRRSHASALAVLGPSLTEDQRRRFVDSVVQDSEPSGPDASLFAQFGDSWAAPLSPYLSSGRREAGLTRHLKQLVLIVGTPPEVARSPFDYFPLFDRSIRGAARAALVTLDAELVPAAVAAALDLRLDDGRADVLQILLPRCDPGLRRDVLNREMTRLSRIGDEERADEVVAALVPWCRTEERGPLAIASVAAAVRAGCRSAGFAVLLGLLPCLDEAGREAALEAAFEATGQIGHEMSAARALASLVPALDNEKVRRAWQMSGAWARDAYLTRAWLVGRYPDGDRRKLVREVLSAMAAAYPGELPEEFLYALAGVATQIHDEDLEILATMIAEVGVVDATHSRRALEILSARLVPDQVRRLRELCVAAWERLLARGFSQGDVRLLESFRDAPAIGPSTEADEPSLRQRLHGSLGQNSKGRVAVLEMVGFNADLLHDLGGDDGVSAVVRAIRDIQRWWP